MSLLRNNHAQNSLNDQQMGIHFCLMIIFLIAGYTRVKRFTCDVLSVEARGVALNHSACAAHCLVRGKSGGYCNDKRVCVCR